MPFSIGPLELIVVLAIALLILGPGKLPEVGSAFGRTIREFRKASSDMDDATDATPAPGRRAPEPSPTYGAAPPRSEEVVPEGTDRYPREGEPSAAAMDELGPTPSTRTTQTPRVADETAS